MNNYVNTQYKMKLKKITDLNECLPKGFFAYDYQVFNGVLVVMIEVEPPKQSLVCTHDGIELLEKDKCWAVDEYLKKFGITIAKDPKSFIDYTLFSTCENAEKWIENEKTIKMLKNVINEMTNDLFLVKHLTSSEMISRGINSLKAEMDELKTQNLPKNENI